MLIRVHGNGFALDRELRDDVQGKIEFSFARFSRQIGKVNVYLADLNGPKKGVDKSMRLVIDFEREPVVVIEEKGEDWPALIDRMTDRAMQTLSRQSKKFRSRMDRTSMSGDRHESNGENAFDDESVWDFLTAGPNRRE
ncbi:MAG: HPF/RaiA family ribosome-associated protein [Pirellulaceae bacterium]|nr:HPF/RaiA family ribosome-associated protein [Pirellulaceae bacterium]